MTIQNGAVPISSGRMVRFAANIPVEVALQCVDGVRIQGRYGDRIKYTLTDHRTMYVAPIVAERIRELDIQPGEMFQVCKRLAKEGQRKIVRWAVERDGEDDTQLEDNLRESLAIANRTNGLCEAEADVPPFPTSSRCCELAKRNGSNDPPAGASNPNGAKDSSTPGEAIPGDLAAKPDTQLAHALKTAIAAAADAEAFAKTLDYSVRFTTDDIRSMGITILIGMQQRTQR
jgi:hypothetical protein